MGFFEDLQQILSDFETSILEDVQKEVQAELSIIAEKPVEDYVVPYMNVQNIGGVLKDMNGNDLSVNKLEGKTVTELVNIINGPGKTPYNPVKDADEILKEIENPIDDFYYILTPNGVKKTYCIFENNKGYMLIGKFADSAKDSVTGTISTDDFLINDQSGSMFSCNFGNFACNEIRFIGTNSIENNWKNNRTIDFIHGIDGKQWKNVWSYIGNPEGERADQVTGDDATNGARYGYYCTYAEDGRGRWKNTNYKAHLVSDSKVSITTDCFTQPGSFNLNDGSDAKFSVSATKDSSGQDVDGANSAFFGSDDGKKAFYDVNTDTINNNSEKVDFNSAVYVFIR